MSVPFSIPFNLQMSTTDSEYMASNNQFLKVPARTQKSPIPQVLTAEQMERQNEVKKKILETRKLSHNDVERKRRDNINERIQDLDTLIPDPEDLRGAKKYKGYILRKTLDYVQYLQHIVEQQRQHIIRLGGIPEATEFVEAHRTPSLSPSPSPSHGHSDAESFWSDIAGQSPPRSDGLEESVYRFETEEAPTAHNTTEMLKGNLGKHFETVEPKALHSITDVVNASSNQS